MLSSIIFVVVSNERPGRSHGVLGVTSLEDAITVSAVAGMSLVPEHATSEAIYAIHQKFPKAVITLATSYPSDSVDRICEKVQLLNLPRPSYYDTTYVNCFERMLDGHT